MNEYRVGSPKYLLSISVVTRHLALVSMKSGEIYFESHRVCVTKATNISSYEIWFKLILFLTKRGKLPIGGILFGLFLSSLF